MFGPPVVRGLARKVGDNETGQSSIYRECNFKDMLKERKLSQEFMTWSETKLRAITCFKEAASDEFICMHGTALPSNFRTFNDLDHLITCERMCWNLPSLSLTGWWEAYIFLTWKHLSAASYLVRQAPMSPWGKQSNSADIQCIWVSNMLQHHLISSEICKSTLFSL